MYNAIIPRQPRRVHACFGRSGGERGLLVSPPKPIRPANGTGTVLRRIVDTDQAKALIYSRLKLTEPGPEYLHFPMSVSETFFDELTAERLVTKRNKYGVPSKTWELVRSRNESLDAMALALAALRVVAPTPARLDMLAKQLEQAAATVRGERPAPAPPSERGTDRAAPRTPWLAPRKGWLR